LTLPHDSSYMRHRQRLTARMLPALFRRISAANIGPKRFHQNRTVSWLISIPLLTEKILDISERQRKANVHHHRQADDLGRL
jgi:hypothetical protein